MENIFKWTIPWVAFSQFEFKGDPKGFVEFLQELEWELDKVPAIFGINPQDTGDIRTRLEKSNKAIIALQKEFPDTKLFLANYKWE